jgi:hypothetical protein
MKIKRMLIPYFKKYNIEVAKYEWKQETNKI